MRHLLLAGVVLAQSGCEQIADLKDDVQGLTEPLVVEGLYLGVAPPDSDQVDLSGTDFAKTAAATVFLADATSIDQLEEAPVEGASVAVRSDAGGSVTLADDGGGKYSATSDDGLTYAGGERFTLSIERDTTHRLSIVAPPDPDADLPAEHTAGQDLIVDLDGQGYDSALVVVLDGQSGDVTFSNEPEGLEEIYRLSRGDGATRVVIPGSAFAGPSVYAVGVAGLNAASGDDYEELNTGLSTFLAGKFRFYAVSTIPVP